MTDKNTAASLKVRTRFAPSPTGFIHLGNIRSALYPWAFARAKGGDFIFSVKEFLGCCNCHYYQLVVYIR